ncbi:MAG TPA: hypothetical protein VHG28_25065 [Longimicrobiaceae bacterium]|nr:hypothetical protein [Longimicrobiaceae bacterium]
MNARRMKFLGGLLLAVTFGTGMVGGFALDRALEAHTPLPPAECEGRDGERRGRILDRLDLTPEQRERVDAILERRRAQTRQFWDTEGAALRAMVDSTRSEIRAVLTPEQRERYDQLRREHDARKREMKGRGGRGL